jgi:hypothetical protein
VSAREQFDDVRMERLQTRIRDLEARLSRCPFLDGALVEDQSLTTSPSTFAHRLGRAPTGVIVVSVTPDAAIGLSATQPTESTKFVAVEASASCTADLWFW